MDESIKQSQQEWISMNFDLPKISLYGKNTRFYVYYI